MLLTVVAFVCTSVISVWYVMVIDLVTKVDIEMVERFAFYERAKKAFAVIATGLVISCLLFCVSACKYTKAVRIS